MRAAIRRSLFKLVSTSSLSIDGAPATGAPQSPPISVACWDSEVARRTVPENSFSSAAAFYFHFPHLIRWSGIGLGDIHNAFALV